jgi:integrator complex subunit 3
MGIERVCSALLRQIEGGNVSPENIWLAESMLKLLTDHRSWLDRLPFLLCTAVYTYLRLIQDHSTKALTNLRNAEVEFTISLLRERFMECVSIGRDLVRLLQSVARVTEFMALWKDIIQNPQHLNPHFSGYLITNYL